jgi:large subunit ribosomal protein L16
MLMPRKLKHRKVSRGKMPGNATRGFNLDYGHFGLKALGRGWITAREIEAARRAMTRYIKRGGAVWIRIFPDKPVTGTPPEVGMGGGKGALDHFVAVVKPGRILFEMDGVTSEIAKEAFRLAAHKLRVPTKFITKD